MGGRGRTIRAHNVLDVSKLSRCKILQDHNRDSDELDAWLLGWRDMRGEKGTRDEKRVWPDVWCTL